MTSSPLTETAFLVLTALADQPLHGYAMIQDIDRTSGGAVKVHAGTLYTVLDRLTREGLVEVEREEIIQSRLRRYYRITGAGAQRLATESARLQRHAEAARLRLGKHGLAWGAGAA